MSTKVRIIFHGGSRERNADGKPNKKGIADNGAFYHAALNVKATYAGFGKTGKLIKFSTGKDCVEGINKQEKSSIHTLDLLCHGTPFSLNLSLEENINCGIVTTWAAKQAVNFYYGAVQYSFSEDCRYVEAIDFTRFSKDARIEIHACNTAKDVTFGMFDTLSEMMSKRLFAAGCFEAVVIGHTDKANPLINGSKTTIQQQDYRHGARAIFHNGKIVKNLNNKGAIEYTEIRKAIGKN
jgi:hypothetical protein